MLTKSQIRWAASHDWFVRDNGNGTITVADRWFNSDTQEEGEVIQIWKGSFRDLRGWAGY